MEMDGEPAEGRVKILITGGGTGGHLYPALAIADALKATNSAVEILFVGSERGLEKEQVPEAGFAFQALSVRGFPRRPGFASIAAGISFLKAVLAARLIIDRFQPEVVFSTGGYASAAVVVGAWLRKVPIVLQEQNSVPGMTNRIAARLAAEVHLAFASARCHFPKRRHLRLSGNPLREQVFQGSRARALRLFRLDEQKTTVLVLGGSQGSRSINRAISEALPRFANRNDLQFLIQTGNVDHEVVLEACRTSPVQSWVRRFIANMGDAYSLADLVVCRAGAMTLSELAVCGLPSILIPYPHAAGDHQMLNAEQFTDAGSALLLSDGDLHGDILAEKIDELLQDRKRLRAMAVNALRLSRPDATRKITHALARFLPGLEPEPEPEAPRGRGSGTRSGPHIGPRPPGITIGPRPPGITIGPRPGGITIGPKREAPGRLPGVGYRTDEGREPSGPRPPRRRAEGPPRRRTVPAGEDARRGRRGGEE